MIKDLVTHKSLKNNIKEVKILKNQSHINLTNLIFPGNQKKVKKREIMVSIFNHKKEFKPSLLTHLLKKTNTKLEEFSILI